MKPKRKRGVYEFTSQELNANRQGFWEESQKQQLGYERLRQCASGAIGIIICIILIVSLLSGAFGPMSAKIEDLSIVFVLGAIALAVGISLLDKWQRFQFDLDADHVAVASGNVYLEIQEGNRGIPSYWLNLDALRWSLSKDQFLVFSNGEPYSIYYAPNSKTILSFERLIDLADSLATNESDASSSCEKSKRDPFSLSDERERTELEEKSHDESSQH